MSRATIVFCIFLAVAYVSALPGSAETEEKKIAEKSEPGKDLDTASSYYSGYGYYGGGLYPSYYSGYSGYYPYAYGHSYGYPAYGGYGGYGGYGLGYGHGLYGGYGLW